MKKDKMDTLFEELWGGFDTEEPAIGHQKRFLDKLVASPSRTTAKTRQGHWGHRAMAIAASLLLLCGLGYTFLDLAPTRDQQVQRISPEISNSSQYFSSLIEEKINELQQENSPETEQIITDALKQLRSLEQDYQSLEQDLLQGGNSKLILKAMINNFQIRIGLLSEVLEQIDVIKNLKQTDYEDATA